MSFNQSRSDKSDPAQYRKSGRSASFNQQRPSSGGHAKGGAPAPSPSISSNRSFRKPGNSQGGQPRVNSPSANQLNESGGAPAAPLHSVHGGASAQLQAHGSSVAQAASATSRPAETTAAPPRGSQAVVKAPTSQPTSMTSDSTPPKTPVKAPGDASKPFAFQFGSISPGFVNGMQIPARTNSAPPNIHEQKRDQAHNGPIKAVPPIPIPPAARQQFTRKDLGSADHSTAAEVHSVPKSTKHTEAQLLTPATHAQKPHVHQASRMSMPMSYHQPPVPVKISAPNPQIQLQGIVPAPVQMQMQIPMPLPVTNAPPQAQQQMFVPGIQSHALPPQGTLHQGQGLSFPHMPQLGNLGMAIGQYTQQQGGQFNGPRKTPVKITHPDTHQEVRLDKPSDTFSDGGISSRSHSHMPPQSQPMASYSAGHQFNYYTNYNPATLYFPGPGSLPVPGAQMTPVSQAPRFNYPVNQGPQSGSFINNQASNLSTSSRTSVLKQGHVEQARQEHVQNPRDGTSYTSSVMREAVKQADGAINRKATGVSSLRSSTAALKIEPPKVSGASSESSQKEIQVVAEFSQKPEIVREPSSSLLSTMTEHSPPEPHALSDASAKPSISSVGLPPHRVSASIVVNAEAGTWETGSNQSTKKQGETDDDPPEPQEKRESPISSLPSHTLLPTTNLVNEGVGTQENGISALGSTAERGDSCESDDTTGVDASGSSEQRDDSMGKGRSSFSSEICDVSRTVTTDDALDEKTMTEGGESMELVNGGIGLLGNTGHVSESSSLKSSEIEEGEEDSICKVDASLEGIPEVGHKKSDQIENVMERVDDSGISTFSAVDGSLMESVSCSVSQSADFHGSSVARSYASESGDGNKDSKGVTDPHHDSTPELQEKSITDHSCIDKSAAEGESMQMSSSSDKPVSELNRSKSMTTKGKKKWRELLQKADAAGSTLDLYMAYKGPEEKKEMMKSSESAETASPRTSSKMGLADARPGGAAPCDDGDQMKAELDWEDAADISTPKLESTTGGKSVDHQDGDAFVGKKYSRDFLLKFADQCTSLPEDFEVTSDIAEAFTTAVNASRSVGRGHQPNPGRMSTGPRLDRRGSGVREDDRWNKAPGTFASGQDLRLDVGLGGNPGFRPGQGANYGVLRNPRAPSPVQHAGGILPGLMQIPGSQGAMQRTGSDADRWQRGTGFQQKGLIPSPQTPLQMMHRAEKKYQVGKVSDEEEAKQRQLKGILNKLTPQNFEKLFDQVIAVQIDNAITLTGLISQIFDKALMEPTFCEMYANLCSHLSQALPDLNEGDQKITFKRLLLNKCQEEFERGEREEEEANKVEEEGEVKQTEGEREEKRIKARRRMLGNIRLIGELYKKRMLTEKIMHECMKKLLGQYQTPDEEDLEALCKLMSTIGEMIDHPKAKIHMDAYFERMTALSNNMALSSRVRFMLKDAIDLRRNKWQQRRKVEGPKKIDEVHRDAALERHAQAGRVDRSSGINISGRRGHQMDFAARGNSLTSPNAQMGSFRELPSQNRGHGGQDVRIEERQTYEPRTLSASLSQRFGGDDTITLGPQGGLGRGLSVRGSSSVLGTSSSDCSYGAVDSRRTPVGSNGFSSMDRSNSYSSSMRSTAAQYSGPALSDPLTSHASRDVRSPRGPQNALWPEETLRDKSIAAIREYYSAKDEKEVALCIKDLNSPSFYPSMVSLWVTDSFERKDMERDLLTKLLINLAKPQDGMLTQGQLIEGFEVVLTTLEDAQSDAPKAPEYLGRMFGKVVAGNVVPLSEIGRILYEGGEERGQLLAAGISADVLGSTLEAIQSDKGEAGLNEIRRSSNLRLEDFGPPSSGSRSSRLEKFM